MFKNIIDKLLNAAGYVKLADPNEGLPVRDIKRLSGEERIQTDPSARAISTGMPGKPGTTNKDPMKRRNPQDTPVRGAAHDINTDLPTQISPQPGMGL